MTTKRYVVFGAAGQLGRDLCPRLDGGVVPLGRADADLTKPDLIQATLDKIRPDVVINCAAYNFVDKAESEPEVAFAVNALGVRNLALACRRLDCTLVHWSTDHVFGLDESRRSPYAEGDAPGPPSAYGLSKLAGEYFARALCPKNFVIRTCGLYGVHGTGGKGTNFVETMLRLAGQGKPLRVVADQTCTPSYTADVAETAAKLMSSTKYGLYHLTNAGSCTWHEFASTIFRLSGNPVSVAPISSQEFSAAARRPAYSVLSLEKLKTVAVPAPRPWQEALADYLRVRAPREG